MSEIEYTRITKYQNEMNLVPLRNFTSVEIDLFFAICTKLKDQGTDKVRYSFNDLKSLSNYHPNNTQERFISDLEHVYDKMQGLTYTERTEHKIKKFILFTYYEIDKKEKYIEIALNPELEHILNNLTGNFTRFELKELTGIKSSYSKHMFRLLKQYRTTGYFKIEISDFRDRLDIPDSYRMTDITKRVLNTIERDLQNIFKGLNIEKIKKGKQIKFLEFRFQKEEPNAEKKRELIFNEELRIQSEKYMRALFK
ncbi:RepB family plasmid replication initiator protein [Macrococcus brunensis]|uniref:RepB family plasmid replication initiator protein n=1 Tax=Macrococcus brunensis TaxID=198483 RepID=A0A4V6PPK3_9STAP|nr:RepB family plasmid replication initiator protein [Macrococcus brunensis]TDL93349.1 RepB family plasmid replication initiator protein [Macrococcus brunensis]